VSAKFGAFRRCLFFMGCIMNALVTGATGFVGSFLCEELIARAHRVTALVRQASDLRWIGQLEMDRCVGDVCEPESLLAAVKGKDIVFHAAGLVRADSRRAFMRVNRDGTRNLVEACLKAGKPPRRFVLVSSQAAAGPSPGPGGIDENHPPYPVSAYGESKLAAEVCLADARGMEAVIVRPSTVYGPRDPETLNFFNLVDRLRIRPLLGGGRALISMIHVHDLTRGIALAGEAPEAAGRTYFLSGPKPHAIGKLMGEIAEVLGRTTVGVPVSHLLLSAGAEFSQFLAQFGRSSARLCHLKVAELVKRYWVVRTERARDELGFEACTSLPEGLRAVVSWYRENGWL
jgi:dihydroflavonol-4-reductase